MSLAAVLNGGSIQLRLFCRSLTPCGLPRLLWDRRGIIFLFVYALIFSGITNADDKLFQNTLKLGTFAPPREVLLADQAITEYLLTKKGIDFEYRVYPSKRMPYTTLTGLTDCFPASPEATFDNGGFIKAVYPHHVYIASIYYKKSEKWKPSWPGDSAFKAARGATKNYNYYAKNGLKLTQINNFKSGPLMVNYGRADYWVDVITTLDPSYNTLLKTEAEGFYLEKFFPSPLSWYFPDTAEGRRLRDIIDSGRKELLANEELYHKIYMNGVKSPLLESAYNDYMGYMKIQFPELFQSAGAGSL